jgi:LysM repeat protein
MAAKLILTSAIAGLMMAGMASAQVQTEDDRFAPRIYGSTAVTGVQYGTTPAPITYVGTPRVATSAPVVTYTESSNITRIVKPVTQDIQTTISAPITYSDTGVVKAQHFKQGDLSDAEYQSLLDEADRIRAYQSTHGSYTGISYAATTPQAAPVDTPYEIELFETPVQETVTYAATTPIAATLTPAATSHRVIKGDTLYNISKRYAVSIDALQSANNISGNNISLGQTLTIPGAATQIITERAVIAPVTTASTLTLVRNVEPIPGQSSGVYAVLPKDTLYSISRRACVTVGAIIETNAITNPNALQPGQRLTMPEGHCLN